jgi:type II secretory pathway component GspD/PulD (secretin)
LFKYQTKNHIRDELLVFIQPTVVNDDIQTLRASLKEESRARIAPDTYELAHPSQSGATVPAPPVRKKHGLSKEY